MRFKDFKIIESVLNEINMTRKLYKMAESLPGVLVGMEFEMLVPTGTAEEVDDRPTEIPDNITTIADVVEFFSIGQSNGLNELEWLGRGLETDFEKWREEQTERIWRREGGRQYFKNFYRSEWFDEEDAMEKAREEAYLRDVPTDDPEYYDLISILVEELLDEEVFDLWHDKNSTAYRQAREQFLEDRSDEFEELTEYEWIYRNQNLERFLRNITNDYDLAWPLADDVSKDPNAFIKATAADFQKVIGRTVNWGPRYKSCPRGNHYCIEPDGSLEPRRRDAMGLEFVSPAMPLDEILKDLDTIKKWADKKGIYTNDSTGLHMNISIPGYSVDNLDYVKIALLLGDEKILTDFERLLNIYTVPAMRRIRTAIKDEPRSASYAFEYLHKGLNLLASHSIHSGKTEKYTSINTKKSETSGKEWIEFRSPGNDWLNEKFDLLKPTLMKFIVAFDAAMDPEKNKAEYLKKLYALLSPKLGEDVVKLFAKHSVLPQPRNAQQELKQRLKLRKASRQGGMFTWMVGRSSTDQIQVAAPDERHALLAAAEEWGVSPDDPIIKKWKIVLLKDATAVPKDNTVDPVLVLMPHGPGPWEIYRRNNGRSIEDLRGRTRTLAHQEAIRHMAELGIRGQLLAHYGVRTIESDDLSDIEQQLAQPTGSQNLSDPLAPEGPGPWELYRRSDGSSVHRLSATSPGIAKLNALGHLMTLHDGNSAHLYGVRTIQNT
jgi:hypothetical protein